MSRRSWGRSARGGMVEVIGGILARLAGSPKRPRESCVSRVRRRPMIRPESPDDRQAVLRRCKSPAHRQEPTSMQALANLTPSGKAQVPAAWALYDFANTIFSFAVVSSAIGLWLTQKSQFGERDGNFLLSLGVVISVGLNALVSPILGALSDKGGRRLPFLLAFTA